MAQTIRLNFLRLGDDTTNIMNIDVSLDNTFTQVLEFIVDRYRINGFGLFRVGEFTPIFYQTDRAYDDVPRSLEELDERDQPVWLADQVDDHWPDVARAKRRHLHLLVGGSLAPSTQPAHTHITDELSELQSTFKRLTKKQQATVKGFANKSQPPSKAAQPSNFRRQQNNYADAVLYNGRPFDLSALPVQLFHPVFNNFLRALEGRDPISASEYKHTIEFAHESQKIYNQEHPRWKALLRYLCILLNLDVNSDSRVGNCKPDGLIQSTRLGAPFFPAIVEIKNEIGTGVCDPSIQAGEAYGTCWSQVESSRMRGVCCCPSLLIAITGPWMCILGAVYLDRIIIQPLTDYVSLAGHPQKDENLTRLVRLFRSARTSIAQLSEYYKSLDLSSAVAPTACIHLGNPARFFPHVQEFQDSSGSTFKFQYKGPIDSSEIIRPVYAALTESEENIVVKFAERYHIEGHCLLALSGLAPDVLFYQGPAYPGGYHLVIMKRIGFGSLHEWARTHAGELESLRGDVERALEITHQASLVFADLRAPNVLVFERENCRAGAMLVDFDWCGLEGEVRYPAALNKEIKWATGAEAGALITKQHDMEMLKHMFGQSNSVCSSA